MKRIAPGSKRFLAGSGLLFCCLVSITTRAQSEQGWYEVEAVVFTHENRASQVNERPLADPTQLAWLPRLRELQPVVASLVYPFESAEPPLDALPTTPPADLLQPATDTVFGPQPAPTASRGFRLADRSRDPWIALGTTAALLAREVSRIESAAEHRVLWHETWRQPLLPARQAQAVWVLGGDRYGERHEVEGSLRLSDSGGRVQLDAHLWFSSFLAGFASEGTAWTLPALPLRRTEEDGRTRESGMLDAAALGTWMSSGAWQLLDTRLLTQEADHYIDNPAIGLLIQVRPYEVPPRELPGGDADF